MVGALALVVLVSGCWRLSDTRSLVLWTTVGVPVQVCNVPVDDELGLSASMSFDWGDGSFDTAGIPWDRFDEHCFWHAYAQPGSYQGGVRLAPAHQTEGEQQMTVTVAPAAGHLTASGACACHTSASFSALGLTASVQVLGVLGAPTPVYHWDFGDGTSATSATAMTTHTYAAPGTYAVRVTVTRAWHTDLITQFHAATAWSTTSVRVGP